jgi:endonuclease/exonuclease/phosphatase family metal-dependent hydrolase
MVGQPAVRTEAGRRRTPCQPRGEHRAFGKLTVIDTVTVASLNLHCGVGARGEPFDVKSVICGLDAPIICLQEAWLPESPASGQSVALAESPLLPDGPRAAEDQVAAAASALGAALYRVPLRAARSRSSIGVPAEPGLGQVCIAILTTLPVTSYRIADLGQPPGDGVPRRAQCLHITLGDGTTLRVVNTHLTHRFVSPVQLQALAWWLRRERRRQQTELAPPTLIAGDLNMPRVFAALTPGFMPTVRGRTWPAWQPLIQLDHILLSQGLAATAAEVLPPAGSDHRAIRAELAVAASRARTPASKA